ncbi:MULTISPECIES: hypothetical protein [unclassified Sphingomonas]|uniref:hypothetical protein n=1 Tax=Sphingomonas TaxID=13687 RepID=UPI000967B839|nr:MULTISPECIES: hypothetical protein [unclassified Sphingomonas]MBN8812481.1 hypothetical protein [Sphingomonas sp.]OJY52193.1 MAG: hypothetical protein BGP17_15375 [Sphingomonas sp. 67-41]
MIASLLALTLAGSPPMLCRTVHGRLFASNGNPAMRIWVVGTKRILGIDADEDLLLDRLPANVRKLWAPTGNLFNASIYGDFRVCARKPQRPGVMQRVIVTHAGRLRLDRYDGGPP